MKRTLALILIVSLALAMSGCTIPGIVKTTPGTGEATPTATVKPVTTATPTATAKATATPQATATPVATQKPTVTATVTPTAANDTAANAEVQKYNGTWETTYGIMTFTVRGDHASGVYTYQNGTVEATLSGDGKTMEGMWYEEPTRLPPHDAGKFVFHLSEDGDTIEGEWWYGMDDYGGSWDGTRIQAGTGY